MVVDYSRDRSVARVYLNRPHRLNAVVPELAAGLVAALHRAADDGAAVDVAAPAALAAPSAGDGRWLTWRWSTPTC